MKTLVTILSCLTLVVCLSGKSWATPVTFDLAGTAGGSSVTVSESAVLANLIGTIDTNLDNQIFELADGMTKEVDFFTLSASGLAIWPKDYTVSATLAFDLPDIDAVGNGSGKFATLFGLLSGGTLIWDKSSLPDVFTVNGNTISVTFEDGIYLGCGNTAMVHAYITNQGGGVAPVPEPASMVLLGAGLLGLAFYGKRQKSKA